MKNLLRFWSLTLFLIVFTAEIFAVDSPVPTSPASGATGVAVSGSITWNPVPTATKYWITISTGSNNVDGVIYADTVYGESFNYTGKLGYNTKYYYRLWAWDDAVWSPNADVYDFTTEIANPSLILPVNGASSVTIIPTLSWNAVDGAESYNLIVAKDAGFTDVVISKTGMTDLTYEVLPYVLENSTLYYWKVEAVKGTEVKSTVRHFTTVRSFIPTLFHPVNGNMYYYDAPVFGWTFTENNTGVYSTVELSLDSTFATGVTSVSAGEAVSLVWPASLPLGKTYYWRVLSALGDGTVMSISPVSSFTLYGLATAPSLSWPDGGICYTNDVTINWYVSTGAYGLTFYYQYKKAADAVWSAEASTTGVNAELSGLEPGTVYEYRVKSYNGNAYSDWTVGSFTTHGEGTLVTPIAAWPVENPTVYTTSPQVAWYLDSNGAGLDYIVGFGTEDNTASFTLQAPVSCLYNVIPGLTAGQKYYWAVKSVNSLGQSSAWSNVGSFTVYGNVTDIKPVLNFPVDDATVYTFLPTLSWSAGAAGVVNYDVYCKKSTDAAFTLLTPTHTDLNYFVFAAPLDPGTTYDWYVVAYNASSIASISELGVFETVGGSGSLNPIIIEPKDGVTSWTTTPLLKWYISGMSAYPVTYEVEVATDEAFSDLVYHVTDNPLIYSIPDTLIHGQTYFWRVRSTAGSVTSDWSSPVESFVIYADAAPVEPRLAGLNKGNVVNTLSPVLSWYKPTASNPLTYSLQYATNKEFSNAVTINDLSTLSTKLDNLSSGSTYYWRVQSKTAKGSKSMFSNTGSFIANKVTAVQNEQKKPTEFSLSQNYPNPFNPTTSISFGLKNESFVTLKVYDMMGREVRTLVSETRKAGTYELQWRGDNNFGQSVASGMYLYKITAGNFVQVKKMLFLK